MPEFLHVNNENSLKTLNKSKTKNKFIKYYMNGCGHCEDLEPIWNVVEKKMKKDFPSDNILVIQLNADYQDNANVPKVEAFPTISILNDKKRFNHNGNRDEDSILNFYKLKRKQLNTQKGGTYKNKKGGKWSNKYKKSINCKKPKGFSQKQYCKYGRKKTQKK